MERVRRIGPASWGVLALTVLAAALRFETLASQSFWRDEGLTVWEASKGLGSMLHTIAVTEGHPPVYPLLVWAWVHVFGSGEFAVRSLSALAGVATVPVVYAAGSALASRRAGLVAAALLAASPFHLYYSQEARPYALLILFAAVSLLAFAKVLNTPDADRRWLTIWTVASGLALATHYFAVFLLVPEALWLMSTFGLRRRVLLAVGALAVIGLSLAPLLLAQRREADAYWINASGGDPLHGIVEELVLGPPLYYAAATALGGLLVAGALSLYRRATPAERRAGLLALGLLVATLAIPLAIKLAGAGNYLLARYEATAVLPLVLLLGIALSVRGAGRVPVVATTALCAFLVVIGALDELKPQTQREDWKGAANALGPAPQAQRAIVVAPALTYSHIPMPPPLDLQLPHTQLLPASGARVSEIDVVRLRVPAGDQAQLPTIPPQFHTSEQDTSGTYTVTRLRAARPAVFRPPAPTPRSQAAVVLQSPGR